MKQNIFLIVLDAFRMDRCHGSNKTSKTPCLDKLINQGVLFEQNISSSDGTAVSMASILSGKHPFNISERGGLFQFKLKKDVPLLTNILKKNGYNCQATIPNIWTNKELVSFFDNSDITYPTSQRLQDGLGGKILEKITKLNEPWFYYIHLEDIHKPISYPDNFEDEKYGEDEYDRAVSHVDSWLEKILEKIDSKNTLIVFTSDHGDYLRSIKIKNKRISFEYKSASKPIIKILSRVPIPLWSLKTKSLLLIRDIVTKIKLLRMNNLNLTPYQKRSLFASRSNRDKKLFDDTFHVPLIFYGTTITNKKIPNLVRSIDIFPTILGILGINIKHEIDGRNLWPLFIEKDIDELPAYIEGAVNVNNDNEGAVGIRTSKWKYFRKIKDSKNAFLFDLDIDKFEEQNIIKENVKKAEELEELLQKIINKKQEGKVNFESRTEREQKEIEEELRKLGYI